jgi:hypothetical protein
MFRHFCTFITAISICMLAGCGGGSGSTGNNGNNDSGSGGNNLNSSQSRSRSIVVARSVRGLNALQGFGGASRAVEPLYGPWVRIALQSFDKKRSIQSGYSDGLYWVANINDSTGAGRIDLYTNSTHTNNVGNFTWNAPQWNGAVGQFPVRINFTFNIQASNLPISGTMQFLANDSNVTSGSLSGHFSLPAGDSADFNLAFSGSSLQGPVTVHASDGSSARLDVTAQSSGSLSATLSSSDGFTGAFTLNSDTSGHGSLFDSSNRKVLDISWDSAANATLTYANGSQEHLNLWDI